MALAPSRYELLDRIAVGGMAEVFRAKALGAHGFEKTLAIKKIIPELAKDPEFEERFIVEAKLAVGLSHANVVQVMDFGRFAGTLFIAMELVDGLDLAALLKFYKDKKQRIPIPAAFHISTEMIRGLSFAHSHDVVHRDVSPSNVLLSKAGEVKIADFGIATAMHKELSSDAGRVMGKWRYMSPEQTQAASLTEASDIFSAAVVIFEVFSGRKLFPGTSSDDIAANIHTMPIPKLSEICEGIPVAVDDVLARMFERDPAKRVITGAEVMRGLIEASYTSTIVATALDVEEAVRWACESIETRSDEKTENTPGGAFDEMIRAQLAGAGRETEVARKTAVSSDDVGLANTQLQTLPDVDAGTMIKAGVDAGGVTIWKLERETVAATPQSIRGNTSEQSAVSTPKPEVGETCPGQERRYFEAKTVHKSMRRGVLYSLVVFGGLAAVLVFFALRTRSYEQANTVLVADASPPPVPTVVEAQLRVESTPPGATVIINGHRQREVTPLHVQHEVGSELQVKLFLLGYEDLETTVTLAQDAENLISVELVAFQAGLLVTTKPPGAEVWLGGDLLGTTPLERRDLRPGPDRSLQLKRKDYKTVTLQISLVRDSVVEVRETLKNSLRYGYINISIPNGWAEVFENGKRKPYQQSGRYRMSVGVHTLQLVNPPSGKKKTVRVEVFEKRVETYKFRFDL